MAETGEIIVLRGAAKGTGSTCFSGATRAQIVGTTDKKRARGGGRTINAGAWKTGVAPQIIIECEGLVEALAAIAGSLTNQVIVLHYVGSDGNLKKTCKFCTATGVGRSPFPPMEGSGDTPLIAITFDLHGGTAVDSMETAIVTASDAGDPPTDSGFAPLVHLISAARGAAGATAIPTAHSAWLEASFSKVVGDRTRPSAGTGIPTKVWDTGCDPRLGVLVADEDDHHNAMSDAVIDEIVVLSFAAGAATKTLTCQTARLLEAGTIEAKSRESDGRPSRATLVWDLIGTRATAAVMT